MNVNSRFFSAHSVPGHGWFRLFGAGVGWKDTRRYRLSFSERNGHKKHAMIGAWSFSLLWPKDE